MKYLLAGATMILGLVFLVDSHAGDKDKDKDKAKFTINEVMAKAHKSGLFKKVADGTAEKKDREELAELYKALSLNKPPKGDIEEWKKTTDVMLKIATDAIKDPEAGKKLKVNCGACHKKFK